MEVLLINEALLKSEGFINDGTDGCYVLPSIVLAQEVGLQEIIGTKLLKKIKKLIKDGQMDDPANENYKTLLVDYIKDYLIWATMSEIQIPVSLKTTNSGVIQNWDDKKNAVDLKSIEYLVNYYKDRARFFGKLLADYLCTNASKYPEYNGSTKDGIVGGTEDYCNIYFPDSCNKKRKFYY